jgi:hypothetical protein
MCAAINVSITSMQEDLSCSTCLEPLLNAMTLSPCSHKICEACARKIYGSDFKLEKKPIADVPPCPVCRQAVKECLIDYTIRSLAAKAFEHSPHEPVIKEADVHPDLPIAHAPQTPFKAIDSTKSAPKPSEQLLSFRIVATFGDVMLPARYQSDKYDRCGLMPGAALRLQNAFQKALHIRSQEVSNDTFLVIVKHLSAAAQEKLSFIEHQCFVTQEDFFPCFMLLAHSVALEMLSGKHRLEALVSIAPATICQRNWEQLRSLVKEIAEKGDNPTEYQLKIIKSLCQCKTPELPTALDIIAAGIKFDTKTSKGLAIIAQEQAESGNIENARQIQLTLQKYVPFATPEENQAFFSPLVQAINIAEKEAAIRSSFEKIDPVWERNVLVYNELKKKIDEACALKAKPFRMDCIEHPPCSFTEQVLYRLRQVAVQLCRDGMIEEVYEVMEAIQKVIVDDESDKTSSIAYTAVYLFRSSGEEYIDRFIDRFRKRDASVDVNLVLEIVKELTSKNEILKAFSIAEKYLRGPDLIMAFSVFAHCFIGNATKSLESIEAIIVQSPVQEKGKLYVAIVEELAKKDAQKASELIEKEYYPEEDLFEAFIHIAATEIEQEHRHVDAVAKLAHNVSSGKPAQEVLPSIQKAYIRLVEELINRKVEGEARDILLDCIKDYSQEDVRDRLLAKAAISETEPYNFC